MADFQFKSICANIEMLKDMNNMDPEIWLDKNSMHNDRYNDDVMKIMIWRLMFICTAMIYVKATQVQ